MSCDHPYVRPSACLYVKREWVQRTRQIKTWYVFTLLLTYSLHYIIICFLESLFHVCIACIIPMVYYNLTGKIVKPCWIILSAHNYWSLFEFPNQEKQILLFLNGYWVNITIRSSTFMLGYIFILSMFYCANKKGY